MGAKSVPLQSSLHLVAWGVRALGCAEGGSGGGERIGQPVFWD